MKVIQIYLFISIYSSLHVVNYMTVRTSCQTPILGNAKFNKYFCDDNKAELQFTIGYKSILAKGAVIQHERVCTSPFIKLKVTAPIFIFFNEQKKFKIIPLDLSQTKKMSEFVPQVNYLPDVEREFGELKAGNFVNQQFLPNQFLFRQIKSADKNEKKHYIHNKYLKLELDSRLSKLKSFYDIEHNPEYEVTCQIKEGDLGKLEYNGEKIQYVNITFDKQANKFNSQHYYRILNKAGDSERLQAQENRRVII